MPMSPFSAWSTCSDFSRRQVVTGGAAVWTRCGDSGTRCLCHMLMTTCCPGSNPSSVGTGPLTSLHSIHFFSCKTATCPCCLGCRLLLTARAEVSGLQLLCVYVYFFLSFFFFFCLESEWGRKRETSIGYLPHMLHLGSNPQANMCPDQELNLRSFSAQDDAQLAKPQSPELCLPF